MSKKPSSAAALAKKGLGLRSAHPTTQEIQKQTQANLVKYKEQPAACKLMGHFANLLSASHLENLPQLREGQAQYAASYEMHCFQHNGTEYCREAKTEHKADMPAVRTIKYWSKNSSGTQQPISALEFDQAQKRRDAKPQDALMAPKKTKNTQKLLMAPKKPKLSKKK
jgi:hypothetical protein